MKIIPIYTDKDNDRLILIFAGWSTQPDFYRPLKRDGWDLAVVADYTDFHLSKSFLKNYTTVYVYAWSLGVYAAARTLDNDDFTAAFAINGTERPADDTYGIPVKIYRGTSATLSENNLFKFRLRMCGGRDSMRTLTDSLSAPDDIAHLRTELDAIESDAASHPSLRMRWNRAYIADADRIFPPAAQNAYWESRRDVPVVTLQSSHLPDLATIVASSTPDPAQTARNFSAALSTYDEYASPQAAIADRLTHILIESNPAVGGSILELGHGSGLFTRRYAPVLRPAVADFVDLYPTPHFGIAPVENYHIADAERWIASHHEPKRDFILSSACLQWFANTDEFFRNAALTLRPGGSLLFSTFLPGNLRELDRLRPTPLSYPSADEIERLLRRRFPSLRIETETIRHRFDSPRQALAHLAFTGVKGNVQATARFPLRDALRDGDAYVLTYEVLYAIASF